ncbi:polymorphic toxin-type HINT domain-containing protein [Streptomyces sp. ML-6]|nr:polymorphic toxin-type HINT domain-containing protein [Streptomyces sp. ML-6]
MLGAAGATKWASLGKCRKAGNSFTSDTPVLLADGTRKPIKDIQIGDEVLATDPETGETGSRPVTALIKGTGDKQLVDITLDTGASHSLTATDGHPFWVPALNRWIEADELTAGQWLRTSSGTWVQITAVTRRTTSTTVYNLTVANFHTYYVLAGSTPVLVHNCNKNQGVYIFDDKSKPSHVYIGKTNNFNVRLNKHADLGRRDKDGPVICIHVCGDDTALRIREHIMKVQFEKMGFKLSSGIEGFGRNLYNKRQATQPELPFE